MALFGGNRKKIGLFGTIDPYDTPGYGDGMGPGVMPQGVPEQAQEAPKGIWNGGKFTARDGIGLALGAIGDGLAQHYGGQAMVAPMLMGRIQQRDEMKRAEAQYQRRRQDAMTDWQTQQKWERDNPKPVNNDTVADYNFIRQTLGDQSARDYLSNKTLPPPFVQRNSDGTSTLYPQGLPRGNSGPQPGMIRNGYQFKGGNPNDQSNWVEMPNQAAPSGGQGGPDMGYNGQGAPSISQQEAATVLQSLGGDRNAFNQWMRQHRVSIRP